MTQKRNDDSWNEILAALDAAEIPDEFLSESERDMRLPQVRLTVEEMFDDDDERIALTDDLHREN